jgi:hypothetical protein
LAIFVGVFFAPSGESKPAPIIDASLDLAHDGIAHRLRRPSAHLLNLPQDVFVFGWTFGQVYPPFASASAEHDRNRRQTGRRPAVQELP